MSRSDVDVNGVLTGCAARTARSAGRRSCSP